jgi:hypothetical protein
VQWSNYRGQADIGFIKIIDFMVEMGSFNIQMNKKRRFSNFQKILSKKFDFQNLNLKYIFQIFHILKINFWTILYEKVENFSLLFI